MSINAPQNCIPLVLSSITDTPTICISTASPHHQGGRALVHCGCSRSAISAFPPFRALEIWGRQFDIVLLSQKAKHWQSCDHFTYFCAGVAFGGPSVCVPMCGCVLWKAKVASPKRKTTRVPKQPFLALGLMRRTRAQLNPRASIVCRSARAFAHQPPSKTRGPLASTSNHFERHWPGTPKNGIIGILDKSLSHVCVGEVGVGEID